MLIGIDTIKPMRQNAHRWERVLEGFPMGMDIYAISQTTNHQHIRTERSQILQKIGTKLLPIIRGTTCAYHRDHMQSIEIGLPLKEKHNRGIVTFTQTGRISLIL